MSTPQGDKVPFTTSCRAVPPIPRIEREDTQRVRSAILEYLTQADLENYMTCLGLYAALRFAVSLMRADSEDATHRRLLTMAEMMHVDLPPGTTGGEGPR